MTVQHNTIPSNIRMPLAYIEFDNSKANQGAVSGKQIRLIYGQRASDSSVEALLPTRITGADQGAQFFGKGSMLDGMIQKAMLANAFVETWAIALDDDAAANAAEGAYTFAGPATEAGTANLMIAGRRVRFAIANEDTAEEMATAAAAAINAEARLPVTAAVDGVDATKVNVTCRWDGESGNHIDLRYNYYEGETLPAGAGISVTAMSGGTANPDMTDAIAATPEKRFTAITMPYTDTANLDALATELIERFGPVLQSDGVAYTHFRGTYAETASFGDGRNDHVFSHGGMGLSPTPPWEIAAVNTAIASYFLGQDPARPLQTLELPGVLAPAEADQFSWVENNLLLHDGISVFQENAGGRMAIVTQITNYQENSFGLEDPSYLHVNTPATLGELRYRTRAWVTQNFPRHKLRADADEVPPHTVTPRIFREAYYGGVAKQAETDGLIENARELTDTMVLEINESNPNQLQALTAPDLVNQFRLYTETMQFRV